MNTGSRLSHLICLTCEKEFDSNILINYCQNCSQPLVAVYHLDKIGKRPVWKEMSKSGMWEWKEFLPVFKTSFL